MNGLAGESLTHTSPEQLGTGPVTPRADIYALALTVYQLLTNHVRRRLDGEGVSTRLLPSLTELRPDLPAGLDAVLRKATAPDAESPYATVSAFVASWLDVVSGDEAMGELGPPLGPTRHPPVEAPTRNPYKGLRAFGEADAADFHGVDAQLARLDAELRTASFVAVVGPSGSGKSSLVRAGLLPRVRANGAFVTTMVPGVHPFDEIETALLRIAVNPPASLRALLEEERGPGPGVQTDRARRRGRGLGHRSVRGAVHDHVELDVERDRFIDGLVELVTDPHARVTVVATLARRLLRPAVVARRPRSRAA